MLYSVSRGNSNHAVVCTKPSVVGLKGSEVRRNELDRLVVCRVLSPTLGRVAFSRLREAVGGLGKGTATLVAEVGTLKANNGDIKWQVRPRFDSTCARRLIVRLFFFTTNVFLSRVCLSRGV